MPTQEKDESKRLVTWTVKKFPLRAKNRFVGAAKMNGMTVREALMEAIMLWVGSKGK